MEYSTKKVFDLMKKENINFKKKFGQNFLTDNNIIDSIIDKSLIINDSLVIEIGPGGGALTKKLAQVAKNVLCYEIDTSLSIILNKILKENSNVDIIYKDFLECDIGSDIKKYNYKKKYVIANLPYYITTPIIMKLINSNIDFEKIIIMVQKEVGERFSAKIGTKNYGSLTVFLNYYFEVSKLINVSRNVFNPKPKVDSVVIEFKKKKNILEVKNKELFFKLVKDSFMHKRKTLKNNLVEYDFNQIQDVLSKHQLSKDIRAEQVSLEIFIDIANRIS